VPELKASLGLRPNWNDGISPFWIADFGFKNTHMKLHLFRQNLSTKLKADFQQDYQNFFV